MHCIFIYYIDRLWACLLELKTCEKNRIKVCEPPLISSAIYGLSLINLCLAAVINTLKINF